MVRHNFGYRLLSGKGRLAPIPSDLNDKYRKREAWGILEHFTPVLILEEFYEIFHRVARKGVDPWPEEFLDHALGAQYAKSTSRR